ncbi:MAG: family 20 glycosylhydrolase [Flavobacteriales bacterium]|nr:family 20 glycosylhydrolase [Flavobacteriia bacterium]NCP05635.1 family 20 glycosylhydrolase [Flavobacteriales bacterium]PIV94661.1 MAG: beta-N-acetylhexosaminidase [Flavobacteriaceae bacterium CG17_big_fil_post_rev_8_21_14_2_50_33_15]PIY09683.1 MAG: beta-N-acetylhexosaminidase [Flavobacteriaceae bacterium CG_4_10_14_3_um_filter_33_47]PJB16569.1 MAG: beta-N-acetylhexosaminidase [Flavobacteriaceae bacterium CG_4_9_14_3_um_filter_33_16]
MPFRKIATFIVFISFLFNCKETDISRSEVFIIPKPLKLIINKGHFIINQTTGINYSEEFKVSAEFLKAFIEDGSNIKLKKNNTITFAKDQNISNPEGYTINILPNRININAKTDQGAFYAVQTLRQLLPPEFENGSYTSHTVLLPCITIQDEPQFEYRGMHLDVGRHMFSVAFIKKYIDALAMLKMNTFHWHLTEDQGWRIEIKKYPKLQEIAAFRNETLMGHYSTEPQQFDGKLYGGYYTQEDIKAVVAYAQKRHVTVIPEIELPGHSQAAIAAYPELGCTGEPIEVATKWGVFEDIYCPKEETFKFLEDVLDEVLALFPSEYIHIGGDEAPKTRWKNCEHCQTLIKTKGLKDEHELQSYFISRIETYLNSKGRQIIGWDEILEGGLAPNATVMSWRGTQGAIEAAKQHHKVVMTPTSHCYFDYYQSENENEPLAIGGFLPLEKVYYFNPIPEELTKDEASYILGAQGNIWTEYIPNEKHLEYMAFPRMLAMSEVVWSTPENKNYEDFINSLERFHKRLEILDINYANHLYNIEGQLTSEGYELKTLIKEKFIRFTLDGTLPNLESELYSKPIPITKNTTINAAVFNSEKKLGTTFSQTVNYHKAFGKSITINTLPHKAYSGSGAQGLINGISGSDTRYGDKEWLGFSGEDIEITIDLGQETEIGSVYTRCYAANGQWIYLPKGAQIDLIDNEGKSIFDRYIELLTEGLDSKFTSKIGMEFDGINARYIKLKFQNYGNIPESNQGAGNKAWTFIDEIIVN